MLGERALERVTSIDRDAGRDAVVRKACTPDAKRQRVFIGLEACEEAIRLDHHPRTKRRGPGALEIADGALEVDGAALLARADANVRVDDHHGLDVRRERLQQTPNRARLLAIHAVIEATPAALAKPGNGAIGRAIADQPDLVFPWGA